MLRVQINAHRSGILRFLLGAAFAGALAGCGLPGGGGNLGTTTFGTGSQQYAFARARVPVVVEGLITEGRRGNTHKASMTIGEPKYVVDGAVSVRVSPGVSERYRAKIDTRYLLQEVVSLSEDGKEVAAAADDTGLTDFAARLAKHLPRPATTVSIERTTSEKLQPFRLEKEIDPGSPEEIAAMRSELRRVAAGWDLNFSFLPVPVETSLGGQVVMLMPGGTASCNSPVCFRLPVAYRLKLEPGQPVWKGQAQTHVWLANDGPIASLDIRNHRFARNGARARFRNGMLLSLTARSPGLAEQLLQVPAAIASSAPVTSAIR